MADLSSVFATDESLVENGTWCVMHEPSKAEQAQGQKVIRFLIRSMQSEKYRLEFRKLQRSYNAQFIAGDGHLKPEDQDEFDAVLAGRALVVAWEGVQDSAGKDLPFSPKAIQDVMRQLPRLRRAVFHLARNDDAYKPPDQTRTEREKLAGNSARPSDTTNV